MRYINYEEVYDIECMKQMYESGEPIKNIMQHFGINDTKLYRIMDRVGIQRNRNVYELHCNEESKKLFNETFVDKTYIPFVPEKEYKRHHFNKYYYKEDYFDNIDTPEKAYILGLLYADGSMVPDLHRATISLQERDVSVLHKINELIGSDNQLTYVQSKNENWQSVYRLDICNRHICDALYYHGIVPNKSLILEFPKNFPFELYRHFFRGYVDGDGSISHNRPERVAMVSTKNFCDDAKLFIENYLNVNCFYGKTEPNGITTDLVIGGYNQVRKFLDWIYEDATIYIPRKHETYIDYYVNNNRKNNELRD